MVAAVAPAGPVLPRSTGTAWSAKDARVEREPAVSQASSMRSDLASKSVAWQHLVCEGVMWLSASAY
jgi:hypothetical protein